MGQINEFFRKGQGTLSYYCQGCEGIHSVRVEGEGAWGFNGDYERPTFTPSVLVRSGHYIQPGDCWCSFNERTGRKTSFKCMLCHTFIRDGMVEFLSDCAHELAGQTLPLPPLPPEWRDEPGA